MFITTEVAKTASEVININSLSPTFKALPVLGKLTNALVIGISEYKLE